MPRGSLSARQWTRRPLLASRGSPGRWRAAGNSGVWPFPWCGQERAWDGGRWCEHGVLRLDLDCAVGAPKRSAVAARVAVLPQATGRKQRPRRKEGGPPPPRRGLSSTQDGFSGSRFALRDVSPPTVMPRLACFVTEHARPSVSYVRSCGFMYSRINNDANDGRALRKREL